jgi:hypothetical protein
MRRSCGAIERAATQLTEKSTAHSIAFRLRGIVSAAESGKVCGDDFPATRRRRYLNGSFGSKADIL